jgi:hypothetical protein
MRQELKNYKWHVYGLSESDFDYTIRLVKDMVKARYRDHLQCAEKLKKEEPYAEDILDDVSYYLWVDIQYFWDFCLWRMQAIFEGMITEGFLSHLPKKNMIGLKSKLVAMKEAGYSIEKNLFEEILSWGNLRNALSHCPPEQYRPSILCEDDIYELLDVIKKILVVWRKEEKKVKNID